MFGSIGFTEIIVIFVVALIVIGPQRLPEVAKSLGRAIREFRRATSELQESVNLEADFEAEPRAAEPAPEEKKPAEEAKAEEPPAPEEALSPPAEAAEPAKPQGGETRAT